MLLITESKGIKFVEECLAFLLASLNFFASWIFVASGILISSNLFVLLILLLYIS